jgi:glutathione S-transferase
MITVTAFKWVPPFARGLVRDLRVRWALEEAGIPYRTKLLDLGEQKGEENRALQPFGQVPGYIDDEVRLFESGAIVLHIGERCEALLPMDPAGRARAIAWLISALNSIEPMVQDLGGLSAFYANEEWAKLRRPSLEATVRTRLGELAAALGTKDYLDGRFTAGDLMMTTVLRIKRDVVEEVPPLRAYLARCEARPAFERALAAQLSDFEQR